MTTTKKEKKPAGRQTIFTQEKADLICAKLSEGIPLAEICRGEGMPAVRTVSDWKADRPEFAAAFARAREDGFDAIATDCLRIADDTTGDTKIVGGEDYEREAANTEWIARSKLRVETRLKLLAKWDPKRYGEKLALGGADDLPPIKTMSDQELAARVAVLQKKVSGADEQS